MLFVIFVILLVIGIVLIKLGDWDWKEFIGVPITVIAGLAVLISLIGIGLEYANLDGRIAELETRREMLVYQYENDIYENDNDLGKRELIKEIQEWNEDLAYQQSAQDDFWVGIYWADIYDQFEPISLDKEGVK